MQGSIGEIRIVAFNFVPNGWAACDGQLLSIKENPYLFSVLSNRYGGDGKTTFALPKLNGTADDPTNRVAVGAHERHTGKGNTLGEKGGHTHVTLKPENIPVDAMELEVDVSVNYTVDPVSPHVAADATTDSPVDAYPALWAGPNELYGTKAAATQKLGSTALTASGQVEIANSVYVRSKGAGKPIDIQQETVDMLYVICLAPMEGNETSRAMMGEIRMWAGPHHTIPDGWLPCDGKSYSIGEYTSLFALMGRPYGGDSDSFRVPQLSARVPVHVGPWADLGQVAPTLTAENLPKGAFLMSNQLHLASSYEFAYAPACGTEPDSDEPVGNHVAKLENYELARFGPKADTEASMGASPVHTNGTMQVSGTVAMEPYTTKSWNPAQPYQAINYMICAHGWTQGTDLEATVGEVRMFALPKHFMPPHFDLCSGQSLSRATFPQLRSLIGGLYGDESAHSFVLPDLTAKAVRGATQAKARSYLVGVQNGNNKPTLNMEQLPKLSMKAENTLTVDTAGVSASVEALCSQDGATTKNPANNYYSVLTGDSGDDWATSDEATAVMGTTKVPVAVKMNADVKLVDKGSSQVYDNMMPGTGVNYAICIAGKWPHGMR